MEATTPGRKVVLISCSKRKGHVPAPARDLYISPLFQTSWRYAQAVLRADALWILSAKHGLLHPDTVIEPYNRSLDGMTPQERSEWADRVVEHLREVADVENDTFVFLAGDQYTQLISKRIGHDRCQFPLRGLSIGYRIQVMHDLIGR